MADIGIHWYTGISSQVVVKYNTKSMLLRLRVIDIITSSCKIQYKIKMMTSENGLMLSKTQCKINIGTLGVG